MAEPASALPVVMKAWQYRAFGGGADGLELVDGLPVPKPKAGEVLVRVQAASINPVDWKFQKGIARPIFPRAMPAIPGFDVAGEVVEVGPDAGAFSKGEQVFGMLEMQACGKIGGLAEYAILPAKAAAPRPASVDPAVAACLGVAGMTALQGLRDWGKIPVGSAPEGAKGGPDVPKVLVANAAGGVGHYAVQLAKLAGAHVTATCGQRNLEYVKSLGADEVLDYKTPEGQALKSPSGAKYDVLFDGTLNLDWATVGPVLTPEGKWLHLTPNASLMFGALCSGALAAVFPGRQRLYGVFTDPTTADLAYLAQLSAEGKLKTRVDTKVPFEKAREAWRTSIEGHVTGKVVVVADKC